MSIDLKSNSASVRVQSCNMRGLHRNRRSQYHC